MVESNPGDTTLSFTEDELNGLKEAVQNMFDNAPTDEDFQFWSDLHEHLGGEPLMEEAGEDEPDSSAEGTK